MGSLWIHGIVEINALIGIGLYLSIKMSNEEVIDKIQEFVDDEIRDLSDLDYCEVLEEVSSNLQCSANCKREEI